MKCIYFVTIALAWVLAADTQAQNLNSSRWHIKSGTGLNIPFTKLPTGFGSDPLIDYHGFSIYLQSGATYFFNGKWGLSFDYQIGFSKENRLADADFSQYIYEIYKDRYFINTFTTTTNYSSQPSDVETRRGLLGVVYRHEQNNWIWLPQLSVGVLNFDLHRASASLKEKGTHHIIRHELHAEGAFEEVVTIVPSFTVGYRIFPKWLISSSVGYWAAPAQFSYEERIENILENNSEFHFFEYKKWLHTLHFGIGIVWELGQVK